MFANARLVFSMDFTKGCKLDGYRDLCETFPTQYQTNEFVVVTRSNDLLDLNQHDVVYHSDRQDFGRQIMSADFDGDSYDDLVIVSDGVVDVVRSVLFGHLADTNRNNGLGAMDLGNVAFASHVTSITNLDGIAVPSVVDYNGDGVADLLLSTATSKWRIDGRMLRMMTGPVAVYMLGMDVVLNHGLGDGRLFAGVGDFAGETAFGKHRGDVVIATSGGTFPSIDVIMDLDKFPSDGEDAFDPSGERFYANGTDLTFVGSSDVNNDDLSDLLFMLASHAEGEAPSAVVIFGESCLPQLIGRGFTSTTTTTATSTTTTATTKTGTSTTTSATTTTTATATTFTSTSATETSTTMTTTTTTTTTGSCSPVKPVSLSDGNPAFVVPAGVPSRFVIDVGSYSLELGSGVDDDDAVSGDGGNSADAFVIDIAGGIGGFAFSSTPESPEYVKMEYAGIFMGEEGVAGKLEGRATFVEDGCYTDVAVGYVTAAAPAALVDFELTLDADLETFGPEDQIDYFSDFAFLLDSILPFDFRMANFVVSRMVSGSVIMSVGVHGLATCDEYVAVKMALLALALPDNKLKLAEDLGGVRTDIGAIINLNGGCQTTSTTTVTATTTTGMCNGEYDPANCTMFSSMAPQHCDVTVFERPLADLCPELCNSCTTSTTSTTSTTATSTTTTVSSTTTTTTTVSSTTMTTTTTGTPTTTTGTGTTDTGTSSTTTATETSTTASTTTTTTTGTGTLTTATNTSTTITTSTTTGSTTTSTVSSSTTTPDCYGVPDIDECALFDESHCDQESVTSGMLISDECPALCGTCIPPVCNGQPDPEVCEDALTVDNCDDEIFNQSITINCPVLCGTCIPSTTTTTITTTTYSNTTTTTATTSTTTNVTNVTLIAVVTNKESGLDPLIVIVILAICLVLVIFGAIFLSRRKESKDDMLPPPSVLPSMLAPPSYRTSTAATRRVKSDKSAWVPPTAPAYRPPPPYPGTYMPPPIVTDPQTGEQLPLYKPCPPYIQALLIRARQTAQSWGEKKDGGDGASSGGSRPGSVFDAPPKFDARSGAGSSKGGRRSRPRSGLQRAAPSYQAAPSFGKGSPYSPSGARSSGRRSAGRSMRPAPAYEEPPSHASVFDDDAGWSNDRSSTASSHYGEDDTRA